MISTDPKQIAKRLTEALSREDWFKRAMLRHTERCESPIEVLLGSALLMFDRFDNYEYTSRLVLATQNELPDWDALHNCPRLLLPQFQLDEYRVDWIVRDHWGQFTLIECDGHDFHERTKQQAARDKARDRILQNHGPILHFTGSEIWNNPFDCAEQILSFVSEREEDERERQCRMRGIAS